MQQRGDLELAPRHPGPVRGERGVDPRRPPRLGERVPLLAVGQRVRRERTRPGRRQREHLQRHRIGVAAHTAPRRLRWGAGAHDVTPASRIPYIHRPPVRSGAQVTGWGGVGPGSLSLLERPSWHPRDMSTVPLPTWLLAVVACVPLLSVVLVAAGVAVSRQSAREAEARSHRDEARQRLRLGLTLITEEGRKATLGWTMLERLAANEHLSRDDRDLALAAVRIMRDVHVRGAAEESAVTDSPRPQG